MKFSLLLGIYDADFIRTPQYKQLLIDFPPGIAAKGVELYLSYGRSYEPGLNKVSCHTCPTLRYLMLSSLGLL